MLSINSTFSFLSCPQVSIKNVTYLETVSKINANCNGNKLKQGSDFHFYSCPQRDFIYHMVFTGTIWTLFGDHVYFKIFWHELYVTSLFCKELYKPNEKKINIIPYANKGGK